MSIAHPDSCSVVYAWVKRLGRKADHSPSYIAEVKTEWSYIYTPLISLHGMLRDSFTFASPSVMQLISERASTETLVATSGS